MSNFFKFNGEETTFIIGKIFSESLKQLFKFLHLLHAHIVFDYSVHIYLHFYPHKKGNLKPFFRLPEKGEQSSAVLQ